MAVDRDLTDLLAEVEKMVGPVVQGECRAEGCDRLATMRKFKTVGPFVFCAAHFAEDRWINRGDDPAWLASL